MDYFTIVGLGFIFVFSFFYSQLKNKRYYNSFLILSIVIAVIRVFYFDGQGNVVGMLKSNSADYLYSPLIFLLVFQILRFVYIQIYKREPAFGATKFSNYDKTAGRYLNLLDYAVETAPLIIAGLLPVIIVRWLN